MTQRNTQAASPDWPGRAEALRALGEKIETRFIAWEESVGVTGKEPVDDPRKESIGVPGITRRMLKDRLDAMQIEIATDINCRIGSHDEPLSGKLREVINAAFLDLKWKIGSDSPVEKPHAVSFIKLISLHTRTAIKKALIELDLPEIRDSAVVKVIAGHVNGSNGAAGYRARVTSDDGIGTGAITLPPR